MPEDRSIGKIKLKTYLVYIKLNGGWLFVTAVLTVKTIYVVLSVMGNIWI